MISYLESLSRGIFIEIGILVVIFLVVWYVNKDKIASIIFAFYPALLFFLNFPYTTQIMALAKNNTLYESLIRLAIFLLFLIPIYFGLEKIFMVNISYSYGGKLVKSVILSLVLLSLTTVLIYHILHLNTIRIFSDQITGIIINSQAFLFWWLVIPFVVAILTL